MNLTGGDVRDLSHQALRDCLLARSHSPAQLSPITKLLAKPLSPQSGLITKIVVLGAIQPGIEHQEASLETLNYLSGKVPADSWQGGASPEVIFRPPC